MRIDLHSHSNRSDGLLSPRALVERAAGQAVTHLALTDHDTIDGLGEARAAAGDRLELVAGLEITSDFNGREIHVLGLFVDPGSPELTAFCESAKELRAGRIERMVEKLARANVRIRLEDVLEEAKGATLARPHLARVLVRYGYAESLQRAFDQYLSPGMPGHVGRDRPSAREVATLVREAGGVTSLAHPGVNRISRQELATLAADGLDAVETRHPDHPPNQAEAFEKWARALALATTGGSDFHADGPDSHGPPGSSLADPAEFERLARLAQGRRRAGS